jgi:hypothetical protein
MQKKIQKKLHTNIFGFKLQMVKKFFVKKSLKNKESIFSEKKGSLKNTRAWK